MSAIPFAAGRLVSAHDFLAAMRDLFKTNRNGVLTTGEFVEAMRRHGAPYTYLDAFLRL